MATREDIQNSARKLIGAAWHHQGRSVHTGIDCIGGIIFIGLDSGLFTEEDVKAFDIVDYSRTPTTFELLIQKMRKHMDEIPIAEVKEGDVLALRMPSETLTSHVGTVVKGEREYMMIHSLESRTTKEEPVRRWKKHITHAFRFKGIEE